MPAASQATRIWLTFGRLAATSVANSPCYRSIGRTMRLAGARTSCKLSQEPCQTLLQRHECDRLELIGRFAKPPAQKVDQRRGEGRPPIDQGLERRPGDRNERRRPNTDRVSGSDAAIEQSDFAECGTRADMAKGDFAPFGADDRQSDLAGIDDEHRIRLVTAQEYDFAGIVFSRPRHRGDKPECLVFEACKEPDLAQSRDHVGYLEHAGFPSADRQASKLYTSFGVRALRVRICCRAK